MKRRAFFGTFAASAAAQPPSEARAANEGTAPTKASAAGRASRVSYPRVFRGEKLRMIAFPLGGVAAGSISLGGRGQLRDWEIYNRPDKGNNPGYAFPSIWVQAGKAKPEARVLEARFAPPYEGQNGLGSANAPGLRRLESAVFTGEYPLARIDFRDAKLPVKVWLEAFSPFIPHNADDSGLPVAILRYRVRNPGKEPAKVSIAWSVENMCGQGGGRTAARAAKGDTRESEFRKDGRLHGLLMSNPGLAGDHETKGSFALAVIDTSGGDVSFLRGWPRVSWWSAAMLFWDDFTADGRLGPEPAEMGPVGALCLQREIASGAEAEYTFMLSWHYPNRTPERCGWRAPKGDEKTVIGNWYATKFTDAWEAAKYTAQNLDRLEKQTKLFASALRESTLPAVVKEAASANFSTLATQTCFRTADGEFHGFEGSNDHLGCCTGNCTHVWNYETTTSYLFPSFSKSLRKAAFGYSLDDDGAIHFRQLLPDGKERSGFAAADGQMGQIIHAYMDYSLSGDLDWLSEIWPRVKRAMEFAWKPGGWDADRDGVLEGVQHNTYDVEFYGPNPQCGIYYLGALRAAEEMAKAVGDRAAGAEYRTLYEKGRAATDATLFNGEYYIQKVRGTKREEIHPATISSMGSRITESPEYQLGDGCLVDQLVGQYLAEVAGLGALIDEKKCRKTLESIYKYNYKRNLYDHDSVQRIFALNDESALIICDYGRGTRPRIPFPYWAEVMTGFEYSAATHMLYAGMIREGLECIESIRARYDGERRNPWNEAECGNHYARAMAAWSGVLALSGFRYDGVTREVAALPQRGRPGFKSVWLSGTGWGTFTQGAGRTSIEVLHGELKLRSAVVPGASVSRVMAAGTAMLHTVEREGRRVRVRLEKEITLAEGQTVSIEA